MTVSKAPMRPRPLSPFMLGTTYRLQISSVLSFAHRATGIALCVGMALVALWLIAAASGPDAYEQFQDCAGSIPGKVLLAGWTWALFYHLLNGIRHLFWDIGKGYSLPVMTMSGMAVVAFSFILTAIVWVAA